jgi:hypothetical protein
MENLLFHAEAEGLISTFPDPMGFFFDKLLVFGQIR